MDANLFRYVWQHSKREQIFVLGLIALSLPFYWLSLDVPKRIVNEALQGRAFQDGNTTATLFSASIQLPEFLGGGEFVISDGWAFDQLHYLFALSFLFLFFVLCNGAFKYVINLRKGILGERMLRRLRYDLFAKLMRFRPERVRTVKPAEAASMINNEVEPIGGFIGDAFIQPAFFASQALTALLFIVVQNFWLGVVALSVVLIQAFVIPILRREQIRLGRQRQIASRRLAGRIGEMVDQARLIRVHGLQAYSEAEVVDRLDHLFVIRAALFKRKFAVKYLNNFLAQITPFFFYAIGGYFALTGSLDLGQLVAVIAAYRDLPPPIKELINWDQQRADVTVKYEQVVSQFSAEPGDEFGEQVIDAPPPTAPLVIESLRILDQRGTPLLEGFNATIERPGHVALVGPSSSGRDLVARTIARQVTEFEGRVRIGGVDVRALSDGLAPQIIGYVPPDPILVSGSIRDNVTIAFRRNAPKISDLEERKWREAAQSGNPLLEIHAGWHDYKSLGLKSPEDLEHRIVSVLATLGMADDLYGFGLKGKVGEIKRPEIAEPLIEARRRIRARLIEQNLPHLIEPFDFNEFNPQATLAENLVFGVVASERLRGTGLASDTYFRTIIAAEALEQPLMETGLRIAESAIEVFGGLPAGHPLFDRFSMIASEHLDDYADIVDRARSSAAPQLSSESRNILITLALAYIEPRHRLGLVTPELKRRILRARASFRRYLPHEYQQEIEFYQSDRIMGAAPLRDNLLFGRIAQNVANADKRVSDVLNHVLPELGLMETIYSLGLDYDVGPGGRGLFTEQRIAIALARNLIQRPEILVLEETLRPFGIHHRRRLLDRIRADMRDRTMIVTFDELDEAEGFDCVYTFSGTRGELRRGDRTSEHPPPEQPSDTQPQTTLVREVGT